MTKQDLILLMYYLQVKDLITHWLFLIFFLA